MALNQAFYPQANTVNVAISNVTANVQVNTLTGGAGAGTGYQIRLYNNSSSTAFVAFGSSSSVAATLTTSLPLAPNAVEVFTVPYQTNYVAVIAAAAGGTLYATAGEGM
jgi:hypothetical protein